MHEVINKNFRKNVAMRPHNLLGISPYSGNVEVEITYSGNASANGQS
jgi:hypothetical protein